MSIRSLVVAAAAVVCVAGGARPVVVGFQSQSEPAVTLRMLTTASREAADRLRARLVAGESFVTLAMAESTAPSAADGGWLGRVPLSQLRPEIRRAVDGLQPGQLSEVVSLPTGFAIFKVEADEGTTASGPINLAIASTGAVKYVYDVSGFTDARVSLESLPKTAGWNLDPQQTCEARDAAIAATRASVVDYLSPANGFARAGRDSLDLMQMVVGLGQLAAFEGRMDRAIARFREATTLATSRLPEAAVQMEEALGLAHFHKAGLDNGIFAHPGDFCLLSLAPSRPYPKPEDASTAITHFERYLSSRPNDLEVRWFLNLAYMATGGYPDRVPPSQLIPPAVFAGSSDVGRFVDVAGPAGLVNFESAGGVIVDDFRGTGLFDIVTSTSDKCGSARFHVNNGDGTFTDRTAPAGLARQLGGLNAVGGDFNNDGCPDVLLLRGGWEELPQRRSLLRNNCDGTFTDVTVASGLGAPTASQTAVWFDFDNDGWLDLFIGNENMRAQLFRNRGDGTFEDVAAAAGVDRVAFTKGVVAADYDNDRDADLFVSNYGGSNFLYRNNGDGTFTDVATAARVLGTPQGFAAWFFDFDNDGWQDLFVTSYVASIDDMVRDLLGLPHNGTTMKLYRNQQDGSFRDVTTDTGLNRVLMPMGSNFGDLDNDGFLDMYLGTGNPSYGALQGSVLLHNIDGRRFVDVTASSGTGELHRGHGVAFADMDGDGDEDIVFQVGGVTPGDRHGIRLFENPGHGNDWLALKLVGRTSNRSAVGARLTVTVVDAAGHQRTIHRAVTPGSSFGGNPLAQHVGLGREARRVDVDVWWPTSNRRQRFEDVGRNKWLSIDELADRVTTLPRSSVVLGGSTRERR